MSNPNGGAAKGEVRVELLIAGQVQGVFFRASTQAEAMRLGVCGEVGNLADGRVEAVAEGPREALEEFVAWCRRGPPSAEVESVQEKWTDPTGEFRTFTVRR